MDHRRHNPILRHCRSLLIVLGLCHMPALPAQQAAARAPAVHPATPPAQAPSAQLQMEVYRGFNTLGPVRGFRGPPMAVDVGTGLTLCPDGNTVVSTMNIGGWLYQVPDACTSAGQQGHVRVDKPLQPVAGTAPHSAPAAGPPVIRCDPSTWRCTSTAP
jgi:hypothetical protein